MDYFTPTGILSEGPGRRQLRRHTGRRSSPSGGKVAQQGFASAEPYIYENEVTEWGKPVKYQLIHDTGWPIYAESIAVEAGQPRAKYADCFKKLVPIMQQATVDYLNDPAKTNTIILDAGRSSSTTAGSTARVWPTTPSRRCSTTASSATAPTA